MCRHPKQRRKSTVTRSENEGQGAGFGGGWGWVISVVRLMTVLFSFPPTVMDLLD